MSTSLKILTIDDEAQIRKLLKISLECEQHQVLEAATGKAGLQIAATSPPDLILLDMGLPDMEGLEVLKRIRQWSQVPIIILSVRNDENSIISALDQGADDYLVKPFNINELSARIRVILRRSESSLQDPLFQSGALKVDLANRLVTLHDSPIKLTATEFDLLACLVRHSGKVLTHRHLLKEVWGPNAVEHTQYLRVYVQHLRQKIEAEPTLPKLLITEPGIGYRLNVL